MELGKFIIVILILSLTGCIDWDDDNTTRYQDPSLEARIELAQCLTENDWVMYGSITCSACRAQKKIFGEAFSHVVEVECNPHAENSEVERCLEKKIAETPTWIKEKQGQEIQRIGQFQTLENLAMLTNCPL